MVRVRRGSLAKPTPREQTHAAQPDSGSIVIICQEPSPGRWPALHVGLSPGQADFLGEFLTIGQEFSSPIFLRAHRGVPAGMLKGLALCVLLLLLFLSNQGFSPPHLNSEACITPKLALSGLWSLCIRVGSGRCCIQRKGCQPGQRCPAAPSLKVEGYLPAPALGGDSGQARSKKKALAPRGL